MRTSNQWLPATVTALHDLTPTVREFTIQPEMGTLPAAPGAHLELQVLVGGRPQTRSYSIVGVNAEGYRIAVKRLDAGRGGSLAMWQLAVGDRLWTSVPHNHFALSAGAPAYLLVAGGIGVTPLVMMAESLVRAGAKVRMLFGAGSSAELAYRDGLEALLGPRLVTAAAGQGETLDFAGEIAALPPGGQMYVCGPVPMLDMLRRAWSAANRPEADLRFETFGSSGRLAPQAFSVRMMPQDVQVHVPAGSSLLEALEAAGIAALHDCRRGECGLCAMDVLAIDGEIDHRDVFLGAHEKDRNTRMCVCVSRVVGSVTLDSAYRPEVCAVKAA